MRTRILRSAAVVAAVGLVPLLSTESRSQVQFTDDFERADGPVTGWTTYQGAWSIAGGVMTTTSVVPASWIWAGDPPFTVEGDFSARATVTFPTVPPDAVGRHGGFMFYASVATQRNDPAMNGYTIDWIDRVTDHGFRLLRFDGGVQTALVASTPEIAEPPTEWEIEIEGDTIRVYGDGVIVLEVFDETYREGHFGAWAHTNSTEIAIDDVEIEYTPVLVKACMTASAVSGGAPLSVDFDGSCSTAVGEIVSYEWDFGDGAAATGVTASHVYDFPDVYTATLTVTDADDNAAVAEQVIQVIEVVRGFSDDFSREDGPVDGWTVFQGEWTIFDEQLTANVVGQEYWLWAGDPVVSFPEDFELDLDFQFLVQPGDVVGRHGGIMFCGQDPTIRWQTGGYTIDWIDRVTDHGFRFLRADGNNQFVSLGTAAADLPDPPTHWRVTIEGEVIRFYGDGELLLEAADSTYRNGFLGVWGYSNGQSLAIDNVVLNAPDVVPCFSVSPSAVEPSGTELTFDAGCTRTGGLDITAYRWDFGDGTTATDAVAAHTYAIADVYTVGLEMDLSDGSTIMTERTVEAFEPVSEFSDDFSRADGPPDGWTVTSGDWMLQDETLLIDTPVAPESWIWAGDPPIRFVGVLAIEFTLEFVNIPPDAVGRHGGVFFFAQNANPRFQGNSGYSFDWIDRVDDHGYRFSVWTNGVETAHMSGTADVDPGAVWRVEFEGDTIRLLADGELKGEIIDGTYRRGHIGFWSYFNGQRFTVDDVSVTGDVKPPEIVFKRGDVNDDGRQNIADAQFLLNFLFLGGPTPACGDAADSNDDGRQNIADAQFLLNHLFLGGPEPPAPFTACGSDPSDDDTECPEDFVCK